MITKSRKEKREDTHKKLVDSALKHFELDGLNGARTIDIANTAGVSHGTVFYIFQQEMSFSLLSCTILG
ncbi:MAG: TetR/AcrR family transcriptional regulator [Caldisericia bacterium]